MTDGWRLAPVRAEDLSPEQTEAFLAGIKPEHASHFLPPGQDTHPLPHSIASLLHHPALAKKWLALQFTLLHEGLLSHRQREVMVLRVAWRTRSPYEWVEHATRLAPRYAITPEDIVAISEGRYDRFPALERDLLVATDEMLDDYRIGEETWKRLAAQLDEAQLVEVTFTIGSYTALAMAFESFGVQVEDALRDASVPRFPEE